MGPFDNYVMLILALFRPPSLPYVNSRNKWLDSPLCYLTSLVFNRFSFAFFEVLRLLLQRYVTLAWTLFPQHSKIRNILSQNQWLLYTLHYYWFFLNSDKVQLIYVFTVVINTFLYKKFTRKVQGSRVGIIIIDNLFSSYYKSL